MVEERRCPECGARLGSEPHGEAPCPACLIKLGLAAGQVASPPERIGPYRLVRMLGEGGMGEVWQAEQEEPLERTVAVKLIKPGMDTREVIARFDTERQALAVMSHPNVAQVLDAGSTPEGRPYFVMEYVDGVPITSYCDTERLSTEQRLDLFIQVLRGVQHAHQKGIIHRDIKPSNILVTDRDGRPVPKIIDFGVARATARHETERSMFTEHGQVIGTPEYMSPEQAEFEQPDIDTRTDIYSLGIVLYELLVGALPLDPRELRRAAFDEVRRKILEEIPSRPSERLSSPGELSTRSAESRRTDPRGLARQLRGDLDWITMKALEKDRSRRYGTAGEFEDDIDRYIRNEPVSAGPPGILYRARKFVGRHRLGITVVLAAFVLMAAAAVRENIQARRIATERDTAQQVSEFLAELFKEAGPDISRGEEVTVREVLDRGAVKIDQELAGQPLVQGRLMIELGTVYHKLGLYEQAGPLLIRAFKILSTEYGDDHPDTLRAMRERSILLHNMGKIEESEKLARETMERYVEVLGEDHPDTLKTYGTYGGTLRAQDRLEEAEPYYRAEFDGARRVLGADHEDTLIALHNYAGLLYSQRKYAESEVNYKELLSTMRVKFGDDHPNTLSLLHSVGASLEVQKKYPEAEPFYVEALERRREVLGNDHPSTLLSMAAMAKLHERLDRLELAEPLAREALDGHRRVLGDDHPNTLFAIQNMAWMLYMQDKFIEAEPLYREALELSIRKLGEDHQSTVRARTFVAVVLWEQNRHEEAEKLYLEALAGSLRIMGIEHSHARNTLTDLANLYDEWGKPDKAAALRAKYPEVFDD